MFTYPKDSKFLISRVEVAHEPKPTIQFATFAPRILSIDDAKQLVKELQFAIGTDPVDTVLPSTEEVNIVEEEKVVDAKPSKKKAWAS